MTTTTAERQFTQNWSKIHKDLICKLAETRAHIKINLSEIVFDLTSQNHTNSIYNQLRKTTQVPFKNDGNYRQELKHIAALSSAMLQQLNTNFWQNRENTLSTKLDEHINQSTIWLLRKHSRHDLCLLIDENTKSNENAAQRLNKEYMKKYWKKAETNTSTTIVPNNMEFLHPTILTIQNKLKKYNFLKPLTERNADSPSIQKPENVITHSTPNTNRQLKRKHTGSHGNNTETQKKLKQDPPQAPAITKINPGMQIKTASENTKTSNDPTADTYLRPGEFIEPETTSVADKTPVNTNREINQGTIVEIKQTDIIEPGENAILEDHTTNRTPNLTKTRTKTTGTPLGTLLKKLAKIEKLRRTVANTSNTGVNKSNTLTGLDTEKPKTIHVQNLEDVPPNYTRNLNETSNYTMSSTDNDNTTNPIPDIENTAQTKTGD